MAEYIDRQAAIDAFYKHPNIDWTTLDVLAKINALPSVDVVEVVRCGECKHMTEDGRCLEFADDCLRPSASDYCSYGERKDEIG